MLQINGLNLTHKKDLRVILDKFDLVLNYGDKAAIIGEEELSELDRKYLHFGDRFEHEFLSQDEYEDRTIERTLEIAWDVLKELLALP